MNFIFNDGFARFFLDLINNNIAENIPIGLNLRPVISAILFAIILSLILLKLWRKKVNLKHYNPDEYAPKFKKFNGILLLIVPILIFDFVKNIYQFYSYGFLFEEKTYHFLTEINASFLRNWWEVFIYFIILSSVYKIIFSFANLMFLFFRKRIFKFSMLAYISACVLIDGLKYFFVTQVVEPNHTIIYTVFNQWSESIYLSIGLFLYLILSRRVNAVFSK